MRHTRRIVTSITLSGLFIALSVILQRFLVIPFGMPSLYRLSLGNVPIIMASLFLGPIYGGIVGAASDLLGATIFPVGSLLIWPIISSTLYGVLPWLILKLIVMINKKVKFPLLYPFLGIMFIILELFIFLNDSVRHPFNKTLDPLQFTTGVRIGFTAVMIVFIIGLVLIFHFLEKRYKNVVESRYTGAPSQLALAVFLMAIIVDVLYSSWWKMDAFGSDFIVSVFFHTAIMFILLPFQTGILSVLGNVYAKSSVAHMLGEPFKYKNSDEEEAPISTHQPLSDDNDEKDNN